MGRGVSSGGGQSSLGYLFGDGEAPAPKNAKSAPAECQPANGGASQSVPTNGGASQSVPANVGASQSVPANVGASQSAPTNVSTSPKDKGIPAGIPGNLTNNYHRADGQNCGNFITDRPSTKVHAAPGGGSSLDYLFGGPPPGK